MWPPMPSDVAVGADDHRHRVPADEALDPPLDLLAARERRLIFGADRVDVGGDGGERQADAGRARVVRGARRAAAATRSRSPCWMT